MNEQGAAYTGLYARGIIMMGGGVCCVEDILS